MKQGSGVLRLLVAGVVLIVAHIFGHFKNWTDFGLCLVFALVLILGVYMDSQYHRIADRISQMERLFDRLAPQTRETATDEVETESEG